MPKQVHLSGKSSQSRLCSADAEIGLNSAGQSLNHLFQVSGGVSAALQPNAPLAAASELPSLAAVQLDFPLGPVVYIDISQPLSQQLAPNRSGPVSSRIPEGFRVGLNRLQKSLRSKVPLQVHRLCPKTCRRQGTGKWSLGCSSSIYSSHS